MHTLREEFKIRNDFEVTIGEIGERGQLKSIIGSVVFKLEKNIIVEGVRKLLSPIICHCSSHGQLSSH